MKRVVIIGSQHGNELLGEQLHEYIKRQPATNQLSVEYMLANPRAYARGVRFVESDMNRSYNIGTVSYEARLASRLAAKLHSEGFDLVIDAHTTTVDQPDCIIVPSITDENRAYLVACHIEHIVIMEHAFVKQSLIGTMPRTISVEVSAARVNDALCEQLYKDLTAYVHTEAPHSQKYVYAVRELLERDALPDEEVAALQNFVRCKQGFYPVLVGEEAYRKHTQYLGFKAHDRKSVNLAKDLQL